MSWWIPIVSFGHEYCRQVKKTSRSRGFGSRAKVLVINCLCFDLMISEACIPDWPLLRLTAFQKDMVKHHIFRFFQWRLEVLVPTQPASKQWTRFFMWCARMGRCFLFCAVVSSEEIQGPIFGKHMKVSIHPFWTVDLRNSPPFPPALR